MAVKNVASSGSAPSLKVLQFTTKWESPADGKVIEVPKSGHKAPIATSTLAYRVAWGCKLPPPDLTVCWTISLNGSPKTQGSSPVKWSGRSGEVFINPVFKADDKSTAAGTNTLTLSASQGNDRKESSMKFKAKVVS